MLNLMELAFVACSSQFGFSISVEELAHFLLPLGVGAGFSFRYSCEFLLRGLRFSVRRLFVCTEHVKLSARLSPKCHLDELHGAHLWAVAPLAVFRNLKPVDM